jgi:hypothetical protein
LGTVDKSGICQAIPDDPTDKDHAAVTDSIRDLPRMADLVEKSELSTDTYPNSSTGFDKINAGKVAAWLEIPIGRLRATHAKSPLYDEVMFHPLHRNAMVAEEVQWRIPSGKTDCMLVTSFDKTNPSTIDIQFKPGRISVEYLNTADMESGEMMPGIGFDFEVLYGLYKNPPAMPPIPFSVGLLSLIEKLRDANKNEVAAHPEDFIPTNANTGVNCGPATIPSGG